MSARGLPQITLRLARPLVLHVRWIFSLSLIDSIVDHSAWIVLLWAGTLGLVAPLSALSKSMLNATRVATLPPLPTYVLTPRPPLLPVLSDKLLVVLLPIAAYWVVSLFFHYLDVNDYLPQYRLHTPAELSKRNRVSRYEVVRDVLLQQFIQALTGMLIAMTEPDDTVGSEKYDVAVLARRIRLAQSAVPKILALLRVNGSLLAQKLSAYPQIAGVVLGGQYHAARQTLLGPTGEAASAPAFATWELCLAQICYWLLIPGLQFSFAIFFLDTWQYFLHRGMHMNQWLYRKLFTNFPHQAYGSARPGKSSAVGLALMCDLLHRHASLSTPPALRPLRFWCSLQSSCGRIPP